MRQVNTYMILRNLKQKKRAFGDSTFRDKITISEAEEDQTKL